MTPRNDITISKNTTEGTGETISIADFKGWYPLGCAQ